MKPPILVSFLLLAAAGAVSAQPAAPTQAFRVSSDVARFRGDNGQAYVEVYYSIPQQSLTYVGDSAGVRAELDMAILIARGDSTLVADRWLVPHRVSAEAPPARGMNLVGVYKAMLPPGEHRVVLVAHDNNDPARRDSMAFRLPVRLPDTTRLVLSDLQIASAVHQGQEEGGEQFYKNTLTVIPNVVAMFGESQKCWVYAEAYNVLAGTDRSDYTVRLTLSDAVGKEVISRERPRKRAAESSVLVENFDARTLATGTYSLVLSLLDSSHSVVTAAGKRCYIYNPSLGVDTSLIVSDARVMASDFARMDEAELEREFRVARYIASGEERTQWDELRGAEAKRKFLFGFWSRRREGMRATALERAAYANGAFRTFQREGSLTDRGRVHIMYGPPDDIERHPSEAEMRPYEIWKYEGLQSGVIFVFLQRVLGGEYELVHSTHRSELNDENWTRFAIQQ